MITFFDRTDDAGDQLRVSAFDSGSDGPLLMLTAKGQKVVKAVYLNYEQVQKLTSELRAWVVNARGLVASPPPALWEGDSL